MKKVFYWLFFSPLLFLFSCNGGDLDVGSTNPGDTTVDVWGYVSSAGGNGAFCNSFFEGTREIEVRVSVDRYTGAGTFEGNFWNNRYYVHNDDTGNLEDYQFPAEVPESGTYAVTIDIDGDECYDCCFGNSCSNGGRPSWRGTSAFLNQFPPPSVIYMGDRVGYIDCY